jgi:hypothetical protein
MDCFNIFYEQVEMNSNYDIKLLIQSKNKIDNNTLYFIAPNPPDYRTSFSGSALPFYNKEQAFTNTNNKGKLILDDDNKGTIHLKYPNSYYINLGNVLVVPHIDLIFTINNKERIVEYNVSKNSIPYRSLTHPYTRTSPNFYQPKMNIPVMSQRELLIRSGYPSTNTQIENFW